MTPEMFISKWSKSELKERSACQEHFLDLCKLVGHESPATLDPKGDFFCFERFAEKVDGTDGYADVWKRGFFGIEYKGKRKDLAAAYEQLLKYREDLENPPLLVVCDTDQIVIHTNFTNTVKQTHELALSNLADPASLQLLKFLFFAPDKLKPGTTVALVSEEAARKVAALAESLTTGGTSAMESAKFLMKVVFTLFAEDIGLLPEKLVEQILTQARKSPSQAKPLFERLFSSMRDGDEGAAFLKEIPHFNGGLFEETSALDLGAKDLEVLESASKLDWSSVDPAIFGNLYEYGLGAKKRSKRGVHYTSREDILHLIEPVLLRPWRARWEILRDEISQKLDEKPKPAALAKIKRQIEEFRESLGSIEILDPACGSGNFLVVAMQQLMDLELEVVRFQAQRFQVQALGFHVGPQQLHGIELLEFPHALASVVVWIGHLQWLDHHGYRIQQRPILKKLHPIIHGDSLDQPWPPVEAIIGNPPFIGAKRLRKNLGDVGVVNLFKNWKGRVNAQSDYVCYWFEKAREAVVAGKASRVGLLATSSIRQGKNREVLDRIHRDCRIFFAESSRKWVLKGASVQVSMVGFAATEARDQPVLDGIDVESIHENLSSGVRLTNLKKLKENKGLAYQGNIKAGKFEIKNELALEWLGLPINPNGKSNSDVLRPWVNGADLTERPRNRWIIDFGMPLPANGRAVPGMMHLTEAQAAVYLAPFEHIEKLVKPKRKSAADPNNPEATDGTSAKRRPWFVHGEPRSTFRRAIHGKPRFLAITRHAKHQIFVWLPAETVPDSALIAFASDQDALFGLLHSRIHNIWALAIGSTLEDRPRYTHNTIFETFPLPDNFLTNPPEAITKAATELNKQRNAWLNPPNATPATLKKRKLNELYNRREAGKETWLNNLHRELDKAVLAAYNWSDIADELFAAEDALRTKNPDGEALGLILSRTIPGQAILGRLLSLNSSRP